MDYDIFISCKSEDYKYAEEIYYFLVENGLNTFLAPMELRLLGESEYRKAITSALESTYHLLLFASNPEYINSSWVYYEWDLFINAKLSGFKTGQLVTVWKDVPVKDIPMVLCKYESFNMEDYKQRLLPYVETPAHQERVREAKEIANAREQVFAIAEELKGKIGGILSNDIPKLNEALGKAKITRRVCPVCGCEIAISDKFCRECSWILSPFDGITELADIMFDASDLLKTAQSVYKTNKFHNEKALNDSRCKIGKLEQRCRCLEEEIDSKDVELNQLQLFLNKREEEIRSLQRRIEELEMVHAIEVGKLSQELVVARGQINSTSPELQEKPSETIEETGTEIIPTDRSVQNDDLFDRITKKMQKKF
ncbi:MAG: TIR domain-containing protein [Bacteroidales bacterium]|nr:TIR domain-containing protein [Bacteroidales bacterium]